ncbi:MAG: response regulator transcription factor [Terriglobales bacterium]|jgi:DNA-binding NarL/FixJ family response regulator
MKSAHTKKSTIQVMLLDADPLRLVGFRSVLSEETDIVLNAVPLGALSINAIGNREEINVAILRHEPGRNLGEVMRSLAARGLNLRVLVTGSNMSEEAMLEAIASGAKGCVEDAAPAAELARAIRTVHQGSVWAARRVLAKFVDQSLSASIYGKPLLQRKPLTEREKEILGMLVTGRSNKEISAPLGIEERTVKAHVSKLMRKMGVDNRVALSVHAVTHSLVSPA